MKRSTILLIVLMSALVIAPIIYISLVAKDVMAIKDLVTNGMNINVNTEEQLAYKMKITSLDTTDIPECYINVTTYNGVVVDTLESVNFVIPADGVTAVLRNDSIIVVLDKVNATVFDGLCLTIELPANSQLDVENQVPAVDLRFHDADLSTLVVNTDSDLDMKDTNVGAMYYVYTDKTIGKSLRVSDTNIGAISMKGDNVALTVEDSNMGALGVSETCRTIELFDSNIGCCSWNEACNSKAVIEDCIITTEVLEGELDVRIGENKDVAVSFQTDTTADVDIKSSITIQDEDARVDVSPSGAVVVDKEDATMHITPLGLVVKEGDKEVVKIGLDGIKVND